MSNNVVVVGGGPAGISAAKALRDLGVHVVIIEKENHLGGHLALWDRLFPDGIKAQSLLEDITGNMEGIDVILSANIASINKIQKSYIVKLDNGLSIDANALLLTTGYDLFDAVKKEEYGYGIYENVITNADLERIFVEGKGKLLSRDPKTIGFVHCVGSRDDKICNMNCSKVCCVTAVKQAMEIKELYPNATIFCFYMDLRLFGRKYENMYIRAQQEFGVRFLRGRVSEVSELPDGKLFVKAEDTLYGRPVRLELDLLVLMAGMLPPQRSKELAKELKVNLGEDGFYATKEGFMKHTLSDRRGIFFAGACTGPKNIPETLSEASDAAFECYKYLTGR